MQERPSGWNWSTALIPGVALGFFAVIAYPPQIEGQDKALNQLVETGQQFQAQGRYVEAESLLQSALDRAEASSEALVVARTMNDLGAVKHTRGDYSAAAALYRSATEICERHPAPLDLVAAVLLNQARLAGAEGKFEQAEALCQRALDIDRGHPDTADTMVRLAEVYRATHQFSKAERLLEKAIPILQEALGSEHDRVANACNNLGVLYCDEARFDEAAPLFRRALETYQKAIGRDHFQVAAVLSNLALVQSQKHAYQDAVDLYSRALAIVEKSSGPEHPDVAVIVNNLGQIESLEGRYEDAEKLYLRAIGIWERSFGPTHPDVAGCLMNYAATLRKAHRKKEAAQLVARARQSLAMHNRENPADSLVDWRELQRAAR